MVCKETMNRTTMDKSAETLLRLLDIAINGRACDMINNVDWQSVMNLSQMQGVRGLAYEALEILRQNDATCYSFPDRMTLMQWYAQTVFVEKRNAQYTDWVKKVVELWKEHDIKTIVFKGLAHGRYYPKPSHREFGDFDCYLTDAHGNCAYRQGNEIARDKGMMVEDGWYKHSHVGYRNLTVENHRYFTSARRGGADLALNKNMVQAVKN